MESIFHPFFSYFFSFSVEGRSSIVHILYVKDTMRSLSQVSFNKYFLLAIRHPVMHSLDILTNWLMLPVKNKFLAIFLPYKRYSNKLGFDGMKYASVHPCIPYFLSEDTFYCLLTWEIVLTLL
jgi:hypothetical protein